MPADGPSGDGGIARTLDARDLANRSTALSAELNEHALSGGGVPGGKESIDRDPGAATCFEDRVGPASARTALPTIPGYETPGELGRGGMGIVYHARQTRLNRTCALKMILAGEYASAEAGVRFLAEAETIARLRHPNVVQVYHVGDHEGRLYLEMEFADGGNLAGPPGCPGRRRSWPRPWRRGRPRRIGWGSSIAT
jgi:hypothetical protein